MATGTVYLVGAGPGDPGLLTVRAAELLAAADYVLYDQLLSPEVLRLIPPGTRADPVESLPGKHPDRFHAIHARMIERAAAGDSVVRLKSGDPMVFGRAGEETAALRAAGIPYEIVPGVTAALAAGAYLEIPLTHRLHSSLVTLVTGHECTAKGESALDWANLAGNRGTLAFYMGVRKLGQIAANLIAHGKPADTSATVVHRATWSRQRSVDGTLATIAGRVADAGLEAPAILIVGPVVGLRPESGWFEEKPLLGLRVLVTRPVHQAEELGRLLRERGAEPIYHPLIEIVLPANTDPLDHLIGRLNGIGEPLGRPWLVFTSANGVDAFIRRNAELGRDLRTFGSTQLAAIGGRTALALEKRGLKADLVGTDQSNSEGLIAQMREAARGGRIFLCQAEEGRELLREELAGTAAVEKIAVYAQRPVIDGPPIPSDVGIVTLTSPQLARVYLANCGSEARENIRAGKTVLVVNSPRAAEAIRAAGYPIPAASARPDMESLVEAIRAAHRITC